MVSREEIVRIAKSEKLPLGTIEKDFVLTYTLKKIYESGLKNRLVFKGGTALHKLYLHKRMSIDLDFTAVKPVKTNELKAVIEDREISSKAKEVNETRSSTKIVLSYVSALEYRNSIVIDISKREKPVLKLVERKLKSPYFKEIGILTFQLEELVAEKIRAMLQRNKPRDYLDIYYILNRKNFNLKKAVEIAKKKLKASNDEFDVKKAFSNLHVVRSLWEKNLKEIMPDAPNFDVIIKKLGEKFSQVGEK